MKPDVYYHVAFVSGSLQKLRVPSSMITPTHAIEHGVPFFGWPAMDPEGGRVTVNPRNVLWVQEYEKPEELI